MYQNQMELVAAALLCKLCKLSVKVVLLSSRNQKGVGCSREKSVYASLKFQFRLKIKLILKCVCDGM